MRDVIDLGQKTPAEDAPVAATREPAPTSTPESPPAAALTETDADADNGAQPGVDGASAIPAEELARITEDVIRGLKSVYDPEIPVDIYELGLIYKVDLSDERLLTVDMTLTAPGCPVAGEMPGWVEGAVRGVDGVEDVKVNMVFDPPWTPEKMSDEARLELGWM